MRLIWAPFFPQVEVANAIYEQITPEPFNPLIMHTSSRDDTASSRSKLCDHVLCDANVFSTSVSTKTRMQAILNNYYTTQEC